MWRRRLQAGPIPQQILKLSPDELRKHFEKTSDIINNIVALLIGFCVFCALTLSGPDSRLLGTAPPIPLPLFQLQVSFQLFLFVGPLTLLILSIYAHIHVGYLWCLVRVQRQRDPFGAGLQPLPMWYPPLFFNLPAFARLLRHSTEHLGAYNVCLALRTAGGCTQRTRLEAVCVDLSIPLPVYSIARICVLFFIAVIWPQFLWKLPLNLQNADLTQDNLSYLDLSGAMLWHANLKNVNLSYTSLDDAFLVSANLSGATVKSATAKGVHLKGADLSGADFTDTNLSGADLCATNAAGARFPDRSSSKLANVNWKYACRANNGGEGCGPNFLKWCK
jgi:Pentapeptide repeats (8 copies)